MADVPATNRWFRYAHIVVFLAGTIPLYFVLAELLRAAGLLNPIAWVSGTGTNPDDQAYERPHVAPLNRETVSLAHDLWARAAHDNTQLVRDFRREKGLSRLPVDMGPPEDEDRRTPIVMSARFDDYVYPQQLRSSDVAGVLLGKWVPARPTHPDVRRLAERVQALEALTSTAQTPTAARAS